MFKKIIFLALVSSLCYSLTASDSSKGNQALTQAYTFKGKTYSQIDCSHLVWQAFKKAGYSYPYTTTSALPSSSSFQKVSLNQAQRGDILLFTGHMAFVQSASYSNGALSGSMFGSQSSTGPASTSYNSGSKTYWGGTKKLLGVYRKK